MAGNQAFTNKTMWRIIPSRYPTINLFERIALPSDWEELMALESLTNARLRDEVGDVSLVAPPDRIYGPGASYVMAAFTHINPLGSRFTDGTYGVYYAGDTLDCAIAETKYHRAKFMSSTNEPPMDLEMRVLTAKLNGKLHNLANKRQEFPALYDPNDYTLSQIYAKKLRDAGENGIYYASVRYSSGYCFAIFKPRLISKCKQERHLIYRWNGKSIEHVFEFKEHTSK